MSRLTQDTIELLKTLAFNYIGNNPQDEFGKKKKADVERMVSKLEGIDSLVTHEQEAIRKAIRDIPKNEGCQREGCNEYKEAIEKVTNG